MIDHLTPQNLQDYAKRAVPPAMLLSWDDHLAVCPQCRDRLKPGLALAHWAENLAETDENAHLSHEQLVARAENSVNPRQRFALESHLKQCPTCQEEVADLIQFRQSLEQRSGGRSWVLAAAATAAAVVVFGFWAWRGQHNPSLLNLPAAWSAQDRSLVEQALGSGTLPFSPLPADLSSKAGTLLGASTPNPFAPSSPLGTIVESAQPEFRWQQLPGAISYQVEVYTSDFHLVARSPALTTESWTPEQPLDRGQLYHWQITATTKQSGAVTVPSPPAPDAQFRVLDQTTADRIARAREDVPPGHLLAAALLAQAGMRPEAVRELDLLPPDIRHLPQIENLLTNAQ